MGRMVETPRINIISFRVTDDELQEILEVKQGGHRGTHIRQLVFAGLAAQKGKRSKESA